MRFNTAPYLLTLSSCLLLSVFLRGQSKLPVQYQLDQGRILQMSFPLSHLGQVQQNQLALYIGDQVQSNQIKPSILGRFEINKSDLFFYPSFSLEMGQMYTLQISADEKYVFKAKRLEEAPPKIVQIFPSSQQLPSNLLKFYLHFSEPMQAGNSYAQVALVNQEGDSIQAPFVVLSPELWNDDFTRLTLWLDPGRIKRDLGPNQSLGPVLQVHQTYDLIIKGTWKNQKGIALTKSYQKSFRAIAPERQKIDWKQWQIRWPHAATSESIIIEFSQSMDAALLLRMIQVFNTKDHKVEVQYHLGRDEKTLELTPLKNWQPGLYHLRVDTYLEDICGNNLLRPFDRDLKTDRIVYQEEDFIFIPFEIKE